MTPLIEEQLEAFFREHHPPSGDHSVADIGAGVDGKVSEALGRAVPRVAPLDRYDFDQLDICTGSTPRRYPTVVSCDLLEHVLDPFAAARNIVRSLNSQGWLYVTTVFAFEHHEYPIDMWRFTTTALIHLFAEGRPWAMDVERCWYEEETPHPDFGRRWRVSLVGQRP